MVDSALLSLTEDHIDGPSWGAYVQSFAECVWRRLWDCLQYVFMFSSGGTCCPLRQFAFWVHGADCAVGSDLGIVGLQGTCACSRLAEVRMKCVRVAWWHTGADCPGFVSRSMKPVCLDMVRQTHVLPLCN